MLWYESSGFSDDVLERPITQEDVSTVPVCTLLSMQNVTPLHVETPPQFLSCVALTNALLARTRISFLAHTLSAEYAQRGKQ